MPRQLLLIPLFPVLSTYHLTTNKFNVTGYSTRTKPNPSQTNQPTGPSFSEPIQSKGYCRRRMDVKINTTRCSLQLRSVHSFGWVQNPIYWKVSLTGVPCSNTHLFPWSEHTFPEPKKKKEKPNYLMRERTIR